jgi:hypothetical protein
MESVTVVEQPLLNRFMCISDGDKCEGCGLAVYSGIRIPSLTGIFCNVECLETHLFGTESCRWCGSKMEKPYTSIDSRLCSHDCSENYYAHVRGDRTARLGNGVRFVAWLSKNRRFIFHDLLTPREAESGFCQNVACTQGDSGEPASLAHLRAGTRFCSESCKKQAGRQSRAA